MNTVMIIIGNRIDSFMTKKEKLFKLKKYHYIVGIIVPIIMLIIYLMV